MSAPHGPVSTARIAAYGSLALPLATIGLPLSIYLAPFYAGELGIPLGLLGLTMIVARLSDVVTDPVIGWASDKYRTPWGRRRIWIPVGVAVLLIGVSQLFMPMPPVDSVYFVVWTGVVYFGFTLTQIPHAAWGGELSNDYNGRTRVAAIRQGFSLCGLICATLLPAWVLSRPGASAGDVLEALTWLMMILLPIAALLVVAFTPEPPAPKVEHTVPLLRGLQIAWRNGPFRNIAMALFLGYVAETFRITITLFYARDVIGVQNIGLVYVFYFAVGLAAVPVWSWLAARIGKHRALAGAFSIVVITNVGLFFLNRGDDIPFIAIFMLKGFCFGALELLPAALVADAVDVDTAASRMRRQGLFFAFFAMTNKIGQAIGQGMSLILLSAIGFKAAGGNDAATLVQMKALYALVPAALLAPSIWLIWRHVLTPKRHAHLRAAIERRDLRETGGQSA